MVCLKIVLDVMVTITIGTGFGHIFYKYKYFKISGQNYNIFSLLFFGALWIPLPIKNSNSKQEGRLIRISNYLLYTTYALFLLTFLMFLIFGIENNNMTMDKNKSISKIEYKHLKLPKNLFYLFKKYFDRIVQYTKIWYF